MRIPAALSAEAVPHTGSLISSIRRSCEVTQALARAGGLAQEDGALAAAREAAAASFRNSLRLLCSISVPSTRNESVCFRGPQQGRRANDCLETNRGVCRKAMQKEG